MNEAIAMLARIVEDKDMQIATLMSRLESQYNQEVGSKKDYWQDKESGEKDACQEDKVGTKQKPQSYINKLSFHPTTLGLDRKHHQGTIQRYFARYTDIFKAIHQAD